jgi:hypothetical protein
MPFDYLVPQPQEIEEKGESFPRPPQISIDGDVGTKTCMAVLKKDLKELAGISAKSGSPYVIRVSLGEGQGRAESYLLSLDRNGATISGFDEPGLFYGVQTLLQIFILGDRDAIPSLLIRDWPHYRLRSFMVDMGRSVFRPALLRRTVRILSRLKMNLLHLHITDDQLNSLRFRRLPLGKENPYALTLSQLKKLIAYAHRFHVKIMPEIECWGHASSLLYHFPELEGGPGMWGGASFGIGEEYFQFMENLFDELIPVLDRDCMVHVGLDEAQWFTLASVAKDRRQEYSPERMVGGLYNILTRAGEKHGRNVTMHLRTDQGGLLIPPEIERKVVVQPWQYHERGEKEIEESLKRYGGEGKPPFMMGAGMSVAHFGGHFGGTRIWCKKGKDLPNVEGVTICMWVGNDLVERLIGLYGGSDYAWSPDYPPTRDLKKDPYGEIKRTKVSVKMRRWQALFRDADTEAIQRDRGSEVFWGLYCWGKRAGEPVAPTAPRRDSPNS